MAARAKRELKSGVGKGEHCDNLPADVRLVKELLNFHGKKFGLAFPLNLENPYCGEATINAISAFQKLVMKSKGPYGRVLPKRLGGGATLKALLNTAGGGKASTGSSSGPVTLEHAEQYEGQVLGAAPYQGECAAGVQQVFNEAGKSLGLTSTWKQGKLVKGNNVKPGTAIASFYNGKYWHHAAIFIRETKEGLEVWDQWAGQPWHKRTLRFSKDMEDGSNNGNLFYVIGK